MLKLALPLLFVLTLSFASVFADTNRGTTLILQNNTHSPSITIVKPAEKTTESKISPQTSSQSTPLQITSIVPQTKSIQEQILQQITSLFHFKSGYPTVELSKKQIVEYSIIAAIVLVIIITIASSVRSKNKKPIRK